MEIIDLNKIFATIDANYQQLDVDNMEQFLLATCAEVGAKTGLGSDPHISVLNELAVFYRNSSRYSQATQVFEEILTMIKNIYGDFNLSYAATLNNLASLYRMTENIAKSHELYSQSIRIYEGLEATDNFEYISAVNNLGLLYYVDGKYNQAIILHKRAFKQVQKMNLPPLITASTYANLGAAYLGNKELEAAQKYLLLAVESFETNNLQKNNYYGSALNSLAMYYLEIKDLSAAEQQFIKAMEVKRQFWGEMNHDYAKAAQNLMVVYEAMGNQNKAVEMAGIAARVYSQIFPQNAKPVVDFYQQVKNLGLEI